MEESTLEEWVDHRLLSVVLTCQTPMAQKRHQGPTDFTWVVPLRFLEVRRAQAGYTFIMVVVFIKLFTTTNSITNPPFNRGFVDFMCHFKLTIIYQN